MLLNPIYLLKKQRAFLFIPLIVIAFICTTTLSRAQANGFTPMAEDKDLLTRLASEYQQRYKESLDKLPAKNHKDYLNVYSQRWDNIKTYFDKEEIYTSQEAQAYLDKLVAEIVRGNPSLTGHTFRCYFSRSAVPNAAYVGEGIILFNMGLFYRLDDEAEAAYVLSHEIAHFMLRHPENSMDKYVTAINSEEVQSELRKIRNSEYRRNQQLEGMVKGLAFDSRRHSRDHESQADSMAVELLAHTRFGASGALRALAILDNIDTDSLDTGGCLQRMFNSAKYPFQKKWIYHDEGLLGGHGHLINDKKIEDSLKTHPDCQVRIKTLRPIIETRGSPLGETRWLIDSASFEKWRNIFRYEAIEFAWSSGRYTLSLFLTMELMKDHQGDPYLVANTGRLLNGIYAAQKAHTLSKVVDLPSPEYPANYNLLLQFIQNLYLENISSINYYFLSQYHPQLDGMPLFRNAYEKSVEDNKQ